MESMSVDEKHHFIQDLVQFFGRAATLSSGQCVCLSHIKH